MSFIEKKRTKFLALPICFTTYTINEEKINIKSGFLSITEDDAYMYKIQDVRLKKSLLERIFHIGTVVCFTGDTTHPELVLVHIKHAAEIKDYIMTASEEARRKRRTMHTLDIDVEELDDVDDV
ncbi:PH domain-containing protein [Anaerosporobacter faecicola]|uniref:PH domain-containing protein n=1 Tax=Anaerosporobacter faecicola TaxID=2718714 RepID=UPI00143A8291|nr:PH domain-containing protein [Anaerosporobacter faecicola]